MNPATLTIRQRTALLNAAFGREADLAKVMALRRRQEASDACKTRQRGVS